MLIKETSLDINPFNILNESIYLTKEESQLHPIQVPIIETNNGLNMIEFAYLDKIMNEMNVGFLEAESILAEFNEIPVDSLIISIPEYELIDSPFIMETVDNFVVTPIAPTSDAYTFCESFIFLYEQSGDETFLQALLNEEVARELITAIGMDKSMTAAEKQRAIESLERKDRAEQEKLRKKKEEQKRVEEGKARLNAELEKGKKEMEQRHEAEAKENKRRNDLGFFGRAKEDAGNFWNSRSEQQKSIAKGALKVAAGVGIGSAVGNAILKYQRIKEEAANKPRTWIAKKIAALRSIYANYLHKAEIAKMRGEAGIFKKIASKILGIIDFLLKKLQNATN